MAKYFIYIFICLILGFLDFHFGLRGILSLSFEVILCIYLILSNTNEIKTNFKISFDYKLLYGILLILLILFFKESLLEYFLTYQIDYYDRIDFYFIIAMIVKSFTEEIIFRGYWLKKFLMKHNVVISIITVSIGFALLHFFGRNNAIFAFVSSVLLSHIYYKSKSISNVFIIHLISNLFVVFLLPNILFFYSSIDTWIKILCIAIALLCIIFLWKLIGTKSPAP